MFEWPRSLRHLVISSVVIALFALSAASCDNRSTSVSGPEFVGFGYTPASFLGRWSGSLSALGFFQTAVVDIDAGGMVTGGRDSRGVQIDGGEFRFRDTATGELEFLVELEDGLAVVALGFLEPGGTRITGNFLAEDGLVGDVVLARIPETSALADVPEDVTWDITVLDSTTETTREGKVILGKEGLVLADSVIDDIAVVDGKASISDPDLGVFSLVLTLDDSEAIFGEVLYSHADDRVSGTYTATSPTAEGFLTLAPEESEPEDEDDEPADP